MLHHLIRPVAFTLLLLSAAGSAHAQMGRVTGVVKGEDGQAIKGATVSAENRDIAMSLTATTDDKGRFAIIGLRGGEWRFIAMARGFAPQGGAMLVRTGSSNPPLLFQLPRSGVAYFGALGGITAADLQEKISDADKLFTDRKWDEAIAAYRAILNRSPVLTAIYLQIAAAQRHKNDYEGALATYKDMLVAEPDNRVAPVEIARVWMERGEHGKAEEVLRALAHEPTGTREIYYTLGEIRSAQQDSEGAAAWFRKAADTDPNWAKPLVQLGQAALASGNRAEATRLLTRAIEVDPSAPEATTARTALATLK